MRENTTRRIYDIWSYFYDGLLADTIQRRQRHAISRMDIRPGDLVLDVGIGTGLSIEMYPPDARIVGIDISEGMLRHAKQRASRPNQPETRLAVADAMKLPFADGTFDFIMISHVITVVSDPVQLIRGIRRVGKPGCRIVIINHFQSGNRMMALIEKWLCPLCSHIGWRSDLSLERLMGATGLDVDFRYKLDRFDLWETVFVTNDGPHSSDAAIVAA